MFTVYLYEGEECIAQIQDIFEIDADLKLNGSSQVKITLDAQSPYIQKDLLRMWRSIRITELTEEGEKEMLAGVIRWVEANFTQVEIIAESRRVLLEKRLVDQKYKWNQAPLEEVVRILFEEQNRKSPLPFNIECETGSTGSLEVGEKAVLSSVINSIIKEGVDVFLIGDTLKIGKHIWEDRTQGANYKEFRYDAQDPEGNTIDKAKLVIDAKEMSNKVWGQRSEESIARYGLLEESKSNEDEVTYLKEHKEQVSEFNITVGDDSFYQVELGDKVKVIIKGYNELMHFDGVMKIVGKKYRSGDLPTIEYTVSTQRIPQEWVIGTIKQLSEKVNQKTITTTWPQVDLSWYASSSAVASALQSQNTKIEKKADSSFVQGVAQTAQTALNTANQAKQTAESKAPIQHTHNKSEVWLDQVDNTSDEDKPLSKATKKALELKCSFADIVDNLNTEEIKPLSAKQGKVLKGLIDNINRILVSDDTDLDQLQEIVNYIKQNKKILSQLGISNISGLVEALEGKANKVHTHTKSQISDFPTSMPASDVHKRAKQVNKPTYTISEIQGLQEALDNKSSSVASLDRIDFNYTTNLTQKKFRIGSRYQLSNIPHDQGGHQLQVLWWDLQPQGTGHDGGWGLMFWPDQNPYLQMQGEDVAIGRTGGLINPKTRINFPQSVGLKRDANTDGANIYFRSSSNDDSSLDFKLYDDGSEWFRFLYNNTRRVAFNHDLATYKQKFFVHWQVQYGEFPNISLAIWDSDTGFNRESDGVLSYFSNGSKLQTIHQNAVPVVAEDFGRNVKIKNLTQSQYDALGAGRPNNVIYYITE